MRFFGEQSAAQAEKIGIWQGQFELPWEWRAAQREQTDSSPIVSLAPSVASPAAASRPSGACDIKGNISRKGERIYHVPSQKYYAQTRVSTGKGERWFCSEQEARAAGWRRSQQ
ncbi:sunset domain-containing protein [Ollibium composti]